ncbi:hypothetical protein [Caldalkalibacillus mannanilyticus]|uniref:hypothetical protein n=1 Tax=Caldalkalibacillus mannanilyticus TaxID=1418 RepID=UPI003F72D0BD
MRLQSKLILLISSLLILILFLVGYLFQQLMTATLKEQMGEKALILAKAMAADHEIRAAFSHPEPQQLFNPLPKKQEEGRVLNLLLSGT